MLSCNFPGAALLQAADARRGISARGNAAVARPLRACPTTSAVQLSSRTANSPADAAGGGCARMRLAQPTFGDALTLCFVQGFWIWFEHRLAVESPFDGRPPLGGGRPLICMWRITGGAEHLARRSSSHRRRLCSNVARHGRHPARAPGAAHAGPEGEAVSSRRER